MRSRSTKPHALVDDNIAAMIDDLSRAYSNEKLAAVNTTVLLERARAAGVQFKVLALAVAERFPDDAAGSTIDRAARLEDALRQRLSKHRRRRKVIRDHRQ